MTTRRIVPIDGPPTSSSDTSSSNTSSSNTYSLYLENDLNRVYTGSLPEVAEAELRLVADALLPDRIGPISRVRDGRASLLRFESDADPERLAELAGGLSSALALFADEGTDRPLLHPLPLVDPLVHGTELATTQRYRGKTNERFTRAMLNIALATAGVDPAADRGREPARVLDPMCGRGTTLNWTLAYGLDAIGIEPDDAALDHHRAFLEQWAKRSRLPHKLKAFKPGNAEHRHTTVRIAIDRARMKADEVNTVETFAADGGERSLLERRSVDAIVTDLPYGIQHRAGTGRAGDREGKGKGGGAGEGDTAELLARLLPVWRHWLRPGGALCLAWNTRRCSRLDALIQLADAGFTPVEPADGCSLAHTVDATIRRDVLVATTGSGLQVPGRTASAGSSRAARAAG